MSTARKNVHSINVTNSECEGKRVLVPEGQYLLGYVEHETWLFQGRKKLTIRFAIQNYGANFERIVERHYNVDKFIGGYGKNKEFKAGWKTKFMFEYSHLFGTPMRTDRFAMTHFQKNRFMATVKTVSKNRRGIKIPDGLEYSVVSSLDKICKP